MPSPSTITVTTTPFLIAGPEGPVLVIIANTGSAAVTVLCQNPASALNNRAIAPGASLEVEPSYLTGLVRLVTASGSTTVDLTRYGLTDLRAEAAQHYRVPLQFVDGRSKAAVAASAIAYLNALAGDAA